MRTPSPWSPRLISFASTNGRLPAPPWSIGLEFDEISRVRRRPWRRWGATAFAISRPAATRPPPERTRTELNQRRRAGGTELLLPWERAQYKQLPRLLAKDRRRSLSARIAYYEGKELVRPSDGFARTIQGGRHAVWLPNDDSKGAFAFSIGLVDLHDLPEDPRRSARCPR